MVEWLYKQTFCQQVLFILTFATSWQKKLLSLKGFQKRKFTKRFTLKLWLSRRVKAMLLPDVDAFPGHIACSSASRSEIVIPIFKNNQVVAVLDVDSEQLAHFDTIDQMHLEKICSLIGKMNGI
jgi:hypothetical protein